MEQVWLPIATFAGWTSSDRGSRTSSQRLSSRPIDRQLAETRHASLREVFQAEILLATNIVRHPEFAEGVRALLIDKDRNPAWQFGASREVPVEVLDAFFTPPWADNPLSDL